MMRGVKLIRHIATDWPSNHGLPILLSRLPWQDRQSAMTWSSGAAETTMRGFSS
jgi:hypothetical protein